MEETALRQNTFGIRISSRVMIVTYGLVLFALPFLLSGPQLLVGSVVNALLVLVALRYRNIYTLIPMVMLPSVAAVVHGVIFGSFTPFLAYLMPAIRIANFIFVRMIQSFSKLRAGIFFGSFLKAAFLFLVAYLLIHIGLLPVVFLKAMGFFQLLTALIGGAGAMLLSRRYS